MEAAWASEQGLLLGAPVDTGHSADDRPPPGPPSVSPARRPRVSFGDTTFVAIPARQASLTRSMDSIPSLTPPDAADYASAAARGLMGDFDAPSAVRTVPVAAAMTPFQQQYYEAQREARAARAPGILRADPDHPSPDETPSVPAAMTPPVLASPPGAPLAAAPLSPLRVVCSPPGDEWSRRQPRGPLFALASPAKAPPPNPASASASSIPASSLGSEEEILMPAPAPPAPNGHRTPDTLSQGSDITAAIAQLTHHAPGSLPAAAGIGSGASMRHFDALMKLTGDSEDSDSCAYSSASSGSPVGAEAAPFPANQPDQPALSATSEPTPGPQDDDSDAEVGAEIDAPAEDSEPIPAVGSAGPPEGSEQVSQASASCGGPPPPDSPLAESRPTDLPGPPCVPAVDPAVDPAAASDYDDEEELLLAPPKPPVQAAPTPPSPALPTSVPATPDPVCSLCGLRAHFLPPDGDSPRVEAHAPLFRVVPTADDTEELVPLGGGARPGALVHVLCAVYSPEVWTQGIEKMDFTQLHSQRQSQAGDRDRELGAEGPGLPLFVHLSQAVDRGARIRCALCRRPGATMGCASSRCEWSFHYPCAVVAHLGLGAAVSPHADPERHYAGLRFLETELGVHCGLDHGRRHSKSPHDGSPRRRRGKRSSSPGPDGASPSPSRRRKPTIE